MPRNLHSIINAYITIIPDNKKTKLYRRELYIWDKLAGEGIAYWSPELFNSIGK
jgi:hypothetical protein